MSILNRRSSCPPGLVIQTDQASCANNITLLSNSEPASELVQVGEQLSEDYVQPSGTGRSVRDLKHISLQEKRLLSLRQETASTVSSQCSSPHTPLPTRSTTATPTPSDLSLEGRNLDSPLVGSASLPTNAQPDNTASPSTVKARRNNTFEQAKQLVDSDLKQLLSSAEAILAKTDPSEAEARSAVEGLITTIKELIDLSMDDFKDTVMGHVDNFEEERRTSKGSAKTLYTRLLFILTRCSRLLITDNTNTPPVPQSAGRLRRRLSVCVASEHLKLNDSGGAPAEEVATRLHTMPVGTMNALVQQLRAGGMSGTGGMGGSHGSFLNLQAGRPLEPSSIKPLFLQTNDDMLGPSTTASPSTSTSTSGTAQDTLLTGATPRPGGIIKRIKKKVVKRLDSIRRFMEHSPTSRSPRSDARSDLSESDYTLHSDASTASMSLSGPTSRTPSVSRAPPNLQVRFRDLEPGTYSPSHHLDPHLFLQVPPPLPPPLFANIGSVSHPAPRVPSLLRASSLDTPPTSPSTYADMFHLPSNMPPTMFYQPPPIVVRDDDVSKPVKLAPIRTASRTTTLPSALSINTVPPHPISTPPAIVPGPTPIVDDVLTPQSAVESTPAASDETSSSFSPQPSSTTTAATDILVTCSICEEQYPSEFLAEHSDVCAAVRQCGKQRSVDAYLTTLAKTIEQQVEEGKHKDAIEPDLLKLVEWARHTAALQPDGSKLPSSRCLIIAKQVERYLKQEPSWNMHPVPLTLARRVLKLVNEKSMVLKETLPTRHNLHTASASEAGDTPPHRPPTAPSMSIDEFEIIKPISRGAFGRVYLAKKRATGDLFAIKVMRKRDLIRKNMVQSVANERNILAKTNNPFVVRFFYSFTSRENLYIVMEYLNGGDFYSLLRKMGALDESAAKVYVAETVLALEYCHAQGIIHRDMKPDNLLLASNGHIKLTDFGLSCEGVNDRADTLSTPKDGREEDSRSETSSAGDFEMEPLMEVLTGHRPSLLGTASPRVSSSAARSSDSPQRSRESGDGRHSPRSTTAAAAERADRDRERVARGLRVPDIEVRRTVGTPDYLAPELLLGTGHGPEVDWWSLGAILFEMVTGTPPFNSDTPEQIFNNILDRSIPWPEDEEDMSPECRDLIDQLLASDPTQRLGHRGAGEVKLHPFFADIDWTSLARQKALFIPVTENEADTGYFVPKKPISPRLMAEDLKPCSAKGGRGSPAPLPQAHSSSHLSALDDPPKLGVSFSSAGAGSFVERGADDEALQETVELNRQKSVSESSSSDSDLSPGMDRQFDGFSFANVEALKGHDMAKLQKIREEHSSKDL